VEVGAAVEVVDVSVTVPLVEVAAAVEVDDFFVTVTIVVGVAVELLPPLDDPRSLATPAKNPVLAHTWVASHIIIPANEENVLEYVMTSESPLADKYPEPPPVLPGTPTISLTSGLRETVFAQLSHVAKL